MTGTVCIFNHWKLQEPTGDLTHTFKLLNIFLALPIGTATFTHCSQMKTRLRNRLSNSRGTSAKVGGGGGGGGGGSYVTGGEMDIPPPPSSV